MKTQIIYTLVSSSQDYYLEELWASIYSLRRFHPEVKVLVLTDESTSAHLNKQKTLVSLISEIHIINIPTYYSPKERSRQLKTSARNLINGPFLFIDTDTIITGDLSAIDLINYDIAAVPEFHVPLAANPFRSSIYKTVQRIFNINIEDSKYFYNSGVMYVSDNERTRAFYKKWNENWQYSAFSKGNSQDQPSLIKTDKESGYIIQELPGIYNCQFTMNLAHFYDAKIIHFVASIVSESQTISPFVNGQIYKTIKEEQNISPTTHQQIVNCKTTFNGPITVVGSEMLLFMYSTTGQIFYNLHHNNKHWARFLDRCAGYINLYYRSCKKIKKTLGIKQYN